MILDLVTIKKKNSDVLSKISSEVHQKENLYNLIDDMIETMYANKGIGLSAVQVNVLKRLFIMDIPDVTNGPIVFINPVIKKLSNNLETGEEGCLSIPNLQLDIARPQDILVKYRDADWNEQELFADGIMSICIQHEIDHLNGVLILSRIDQSKKESTVKKLKESNYFFDPEKIASLSY